MKNYPNQASDFGRIRRTLETIRDLNQQGQNVRNDHVLGYECARRQIYTFRNFNYEAATPQSLNARIALEQAKPKSDQGAETFARELRRTLYDLGWLDAQFQLTVDGQSLLASPVGSQTELQLLRDALIDLQVADKSGTYISHPVLVMLHLLDTAPTKARGGLELALEAKDDTPQELQRVIALYQSIKDLPAATRAARLGTTLTQVNNAVKIFPSLAVSAGFVDKTPPNDYSITPLGRSAIHTVLGGMTFRNMTARPTPPPVFVPGTSGPEPETKSRGNGRRNVTVGQKKSSNQVGQHGVDRNINSAPLTPDQQDEARQKLRERTNAHQDLVQYFAGHIGDSRGDIYEDQVSFDLLWQNSADQVCHLFEMKTIKDDADAQVQRAVGQLHYYGFFNVATLFPGAEMTKTLVVDDVIHQDLADYLTAQGIGLIHAAKSQGTLDPLNDLGKDLLALLP